MRHIANDEVLEPKERVVDQKALRSLIGRTEIAGEKVSYYSYGTRRVGSQMSWPIRGRSPQLHSKTIRICWRTSLTAHRNIRSAMNGQDEQLRTQQSISAQSRLPAPWQSSPIRFRVCLLRRINPISNNQTNQGRTCTN